MEKGLFCKCGVKIEHEGVSVLCLQCDSPLCFRCVINSPDGIEVCVECQMLSHSQVKEPCSKCKTKKWTTLTECIMRERHVLIGDFVEDWYCQRCITKHAPCFLCKPSATMNCRNPGVLGCLQCKTILCVDHKNGHVDTCSE